MLRTLPIRKLLRLATVLAVMSFLAIAVFGLIGMLQSNRGLNDQVTATKAMRNGMLADMMHDGIRGDAYHLLYLSVAPTPAKIAAATDSLKESTGELLQALSDLGDLPLPDRMRDSLNFAMPVAQGYADAALAVAGAAAKGETEAQAAMADFNIAFTELEEALESLAGEIEDFSATTTSSAVELNEKLTLGLLAVAWGPVRCCCSATGRPHGTSPNRSNGCAARCARWQRAISPCASAKITRDDDIGAIARDIDIVTSRVLEAMEEQQRLKDERSR